MKRTWSLAPVLQIVQKIVVLAHIYQLTKFGDLTGEQPEIFQGGGGLVGFVYFFKHFVKNTRKKVLQVKIWELFLLDTFKATF